MKTGSRTNMSKRSSAKKHARAKKYSAQTNRHGQEGRTSKFDLLLKGKLRLRKKTFRIKSLDFKP